MLETDIRNQLIIMSYSLILGLIFGAGYDIIRIGDIIMEKTPFRSVLLFLFDFSYMLLMTAAVSIFVYAVNDGDVRFFLLAPMAVGFAVYHFTIGRIVIFFSAVIVRFLRRLVYLTLYLPLRLIFRFMLRCLRQAVQYTVLPLISAFRNLKRLRFTKKNIKSLGKQIRL